MRQIVAGSCQRCLVGLLDEAERPRLLGIDQQGMVLRPVPLDIAMPDAFSGKHKRIAYERLLLDCLMGDATLDSRGDTVEAAWTFIQPILDAWSSDQSIPVYGYPAGTWGPYESDGLLEEEKTWRYPCKNLADDGLYCEL